MQRTLTVRNIGKGDLHFNYDKREADVIYFKFENVEIGFPVHYLYDVLVKKDQSAIDKLTQSSTKDFVYKKEEELV